MAKPKSRHSKTSGLITVNSITSTSILEKCPKFSFEHLKGDYCLSKCTNSEKSALADTLHKLSKVTWNVIFKAPRHGIGFEKISFDSTSGISDKFKSKQIIAFRFCSTAPMLGYREDEVFIFLL